ncbi:TPA: sensor histidine kinase, partial [Burkholderia multivorans]|nr:sensor histidine kinase [Burkholderia multivorans]
QASGQSAAAGERAAGADGRPAAGGRGTRAVLRLPVARIAVQPAAASNHT